MDAKEIQEVEQKVEVAINGAPKTVEFRLNVNEHGNSSNLPKEFLTDALDDLTFIIHEDGLIVMEEKSYRGNSRKSIPFPSSIKIKNNATNQKKAMRILRLVQKGHTAKAFIGKSAFNDSKHLQLQFGRTVEEDLKHLPQWQKEQEACNRARAFHQLVRDAPHTVSITDFESRLTPGKLEEWNQKKNETLHKLMKDFVGYSHYCFNTDV
jgi:hypothetical protein